MAPQNTAYQLEPQQPGSDQKDTDLSHDSIEALRLILDDYHPRNFKIVLWDGQSLDPEDGEEVALTIKFNYPHTLRQFLSSPSQLSLCEGYIYGDFELEGDLGVTLPVAEYLTHKTLPWTKRAKIVLLLLALGRAERIEHFERQANLKIEGSRQSRERARRVISYHYDVSNNFYQLWLDKRMVYSCAYFKTPQDSLDDAQEQKLEHICRKLRLKPGDRLLDIGCGWGALIIHAVKHYGVRATGVTLSTNQARLARERIQTEGLEEQCEVWLMDYRDIDSMGAFDKVVSVGMFEHIGRSQFSTYFKKVWQLLTPGGVFLNHAINEPPSENEYKGPGLINTYVFPDGELVPLCEAQFVAEQVGFEVRDVESLREHYALTLAHWVKRLEKNHQAARLATNDITYRIWRLYMAACSAGFRNGRIQIYQSLYVKPRRDGCSYLPLTREDWYQS